MTTKYPERQPVEKVVGAISIQIHDGHTLQLEATSREAWAQLVAGLVRVAERNLRERAEFEKESAA